MPNRRNEGTMGPRVFVVQEPMQISPVTGQPEPKFSVGDARSFGEIVIVLRWREHVEIGIQGAVDRVAEVLSDFTEDDYLLPVGNPTLIAAAGAAAARATGGRVSVLHWIGGGVRRREAIVFDDATEVDDDDREGGGAGRAVPEPRD